MVLLDIVCKEDLVEEVSDEQITASSSWDGGYGAHKARLTTTDFSKGRGAWTTITNDYNQYIQVKYLLPQSIIQSLNYTTPHTHTLQINYPVLIMDREI